MNTSRRVELLCSIGAGAYGVLLLIVVFLQPYGDSGYPDQWVALHPGVPATSLPYIVAVGLPMLGILLGGIIDAGRGMLPARIVLWLSTAILGIETAPALFLSLGIFLVPAVVLALCASSFSIDAWRPPRHARA